MEDKIDGFFILDTNDEWGVKFSASPPKRRDTQIFCPHTSSTKKISVSLFLFYSICGFSMVS